MRRSRTHKAIGVAIIALLIVGSIPLRDQIRYQRLVLGIRRPMPLTKIVDFDPTAITGVMIGAILGGFREIGASMLWVKVHTLWNEGKGTWLKCLNLMRTVTLLDPHWIDPWRTTAWHLAYNLYVETEDPAERAILLDKGIAALKEGISWNPEEDTLYTELGWTYFDKLDDYEQAAKWFRSCLQLEHPPYVDRLIAHAYERLPDIPNALDWYDYCLKRNPNDTIAKGAILTIRERYLKPWRLMEAGDYQAALDSLNKYIEVNPEGTIGLHLRGHIYEQAGDLENALEAWQKAADNYLLDDQARRKVAEISAALGKEVPGVPTDILRKRSPKKMTAAPRLKKQQ